MRRDKIEAQRDFEVGRPGLVWQRDGASAEFPLVLGQSLTIGRTATNAVVLDSPLVSDVHAKLDYVSGQYIVTDLESGTGTRVNGRPVAHSILSLGDVVEIAGEQLQFADLAPPPEPRGSAQKLMRLGAVALVFGVGLVLLLRAIVPADPGATPSGPSPTATSTTASQVPAAPTPSSGTETPSRSSQDYRASGRESAVVSQVLAQAQQSGVPAADALFDEGQAQMAAGRLREATQLFAAVLERRKGDVRATNRLNEARAQREQAAMGAVSNAERLMAVLRYADAIVLWEQVLALVEPDDPRAQRARDGIETARRQLGR